MALDPMEIIDGARDAAAQSQSAERLNIWVAITVAVLATFMGLCTIKDDNIVQAMQRAQTDTLDYWAFYQARNIRSDIAEATATQLRLARANQMAPQGQAAGSSHAAMAAYDFEIKRYEKEALDQAQKREAIKVLAEDAQKRYDKLNLSDDQFDLAEAALAIAIALLAVTSLTHRWGLYWFAMLSATFGTVMGLAGFMGLPLHPDFLIQWLT
jgi:hypothetical protein